jgi:hypothetical protein
LTFGAALVGGRLGRKSTKDHIEKMDTKQGRANT